MFWNYDFLHKCQYRFFEASLTQCQVWIYCPLNQWVKCGFCFNILKLLLSCNVKKLVCQNHPNLGTSFTKCRTGSCSLQSHNQSDNHWSIGSPHCVDFGIWKKNLHLVQIFCSFEQLKNSWHFEWPVTECSWVGSFTGSYIFS